MRSLIVLLDTAAPSFCYYQPAAPITPCPMTSEVFARVLTLADREGLELQLVCPAEGPAPWVLDAVGRRPCTCYVSSRCPVSAPQDVLVVDSQELVPTVVAPASHTTAVLRVHRGDLARLPQLWEALRERVYRVVVVLLGLEHYDAATLALYQRVLVDLRQRLAANYLRGIPGELNLLSDRLGLSAPADCGAGVEHLTVTPSGRLSLCPGFASDGAPAVGNLEDGWFLENVSLLSRAGAPICGVCDAYQCRRCLYLNRRGTLEVNTPPWQVCRAAHLEREASRLMLADLHEQRCLENLAPLRPLDYDDPLERLVDLRQRTPRGVSAVPRQPLVPAPRGQDRRDAESSRAQVPPPTCPVVGRVTPEERDQIRELHRRRVGLSCILVSLARLDEPSLASSPLYDRVVRDTGIVAIEYERWWERMAAKYAWTRERADQAWTIDFESCEIRLGACQGHPLSGVYSASHAKELQTQ